MRRETVLELGAECASFVLEADFDDEGDPVAFFTWTGGPVDLLEPEEWDPRVEHGPFTWEEVLERYLHGDRAFLVFVHPSIEARIAEERASGRLFVRDLPLALRDGMRSS